MAETVDTPARTIVLLGPQRHEPTLRDAIAEVGTPRRIAAVTAGWEEREHEDQELGEHLGGRTVNLRLFTRGEDVFHKDPELFAAMTERHDRLRALRDLYRERLAHALRDARELARRDGDAALLDPERADAIEHVRHLDQRHLERAREVHAEFAARWRLPEREHIARHRREIAQVLDGCEALCIAGGHVAVLLNRLRMFGVLDMLANDGTSGRPVDGAPGRPVFAWSAGAMALCERVVLFHDNPPQGRGNAELLGPGLSVCRGIVPLPHATKRLWLDDRQRVALLARRFGPAICAALDERTRVSWRGGRWHGAPGTLRLDQDGMLHEVGAA